MERRPVIRALLIFLAIPGSGALVAIAIRELVKAVRNSREDSENTARAKRFASDNGINEEYVSIPTGRRRITRELPEITSRYRDEVGRG